MKKLLIMALIAIAVVCVASPAMAAGDKVRGDEGEGPTVQECTNFDDCPYGDESPAH